MVILQLEEQPPLIQAIFAGEVDAVRKLLESKQDVNYQDFEKRSALHAAAFRGDAAMTKLLIEHGARVNTKDCKWVTPLHRACYSGSEETVTILLNNAADTCARDRLWQTPLHVAAACNSLECVSYLLDRIQNPNVTDRSGRTALHHAVLNGHNDIVELLISRGCIVNACDKKDCRPIHWAAYKGHADTVEILLRHGADINAKDRTQYTPLHVAAASGAVSVIDVLIGNGADIEARNAYGNTPLHVACLNGHGNLAAELIEYKADTEALNYRGQAPLHLAAASTHGVHCLNLLLGYDVDINRQSADGRTPLHMTAIHGRFTRSKTLIDRGAVVDRVDKNGCTALHVAAQYGHELLSNTLLSYGADPNRKGFAGRTPLHMCCLAGYVECCRVFIKAGVDLNERDDSGKTPLHCAAHKGAVECVDLLVSSGADFKLSDDVGRTALHYAAAQGFFFCVFTLVGVGSAANQVDQEGCAALHLAAAYDVDGRCVNYLIEHKADPKLKDAKGFTPIHYAAAGNNANALKYLLYAVGNSYPLYGPDMPSTTPMHIAARNGNAEILEKLMSCMPDPNIRDEHGCTPLLLAARQGYANCVQMLLRFGAKVSVCDDTTGMSPVHHSAKNGHVHCLALLVDNAEDKAVIDRPDDLRRTPLMLAVSNSHADCVTTLIKSGADANVVDGDGHSCLFRAVVTGQHHILQMLLPRSAVVNERETHGKTILHVATACGRLACVQRILPYMNAEAKESTDKQGCTALHWACYSGSADCVTALFDEGIFQRIEGNAFSPIHCAASVGSERCLELLCARYGPEIVNLKDHRSRTPVHVAALHGNGDCVKFLLGQGADVDCQDEDGKTPLISAAFNGRAQVIGILVGNKANLTLQDKRGNTALHTACLRKHSASAMLLLEFINSQEIVNMTNNDRKTALHLTARNGLVDVTRQLIAKGSSVTAVDAEGFTPALCCAPNADVAQCLAIILAHHSTQTCSADGKDESLPSLIPSLKADARTSTSTLRRGHSCNLQTDITLLRDPDQFELERMFEIEFRKTGTSNCGDDNDEGTAAMIGQSDDDGTRFFIRYESSDCLDADESMVTRQESSECVRGSVFELHGSQSDTVLAPKPIYSEEDYEKIIRRPGGDGRATAVDQLGDGRLKTRKKSRIKEELRLPPCRHGVRQLDANLKSKSVASVLSGFPCRDPIGGGGMGAAPKTNRYPKSTNKRLKQTPKAESSETDVTDANGSRCPVCKQLLGSSEHEDEHNIPLEAMQAAIERVLSRKDCSSNRCLLAFLDESYELNAKNAHLIYHGMLSPKCEPYIAKQLDLANERDLEIVESVAEEGTYMVNRKLAKSSSTTSRATVRAACDRAVAKNKLDPPSSYKQHGRSGTEHRQTKWFTGAKQPSNTAGNYNNNRGDKIDNSKLTKTTNDGKTSQRITTQPANAITNVGHGKKSKDCCCYSRRTWLSNGQRRFTSSGPTKTDPNQVQKVQSDRTTGCATKAPKKPKNSSAPDVGTMSREDLADERAKVETRCGGEVPPKQHDSEAKEHKDGSSTALCEYLRPLTDFQRVDIPVKATGEEGGVHVRCYSTYWCFSEPTNEEGGGGGGGNVRGGATRSDPRLERGRALPTGDCAPTMNSVRSEGALKKVTPAKETPTSPVYEEIIFFNDKLLAEEPPQSSTVFFAGCDDDEEEEIEELERLRRLDERQSTDDDGATVENEDETEIASKPAGEACSLERRAGVTDIKNSSADAAVQDWCEDLQQFFTRTRRRQLAEDAEKLTGTERINVDDLKQFAAKELNATPGKSNEEDNIQVLHCDNRVTTIAAATSSEFCVQTTTEKAVDGENSPGNVSLFSDMPTIDGVEHLVKSTILNEDSEMFLDDIQKQKQQASPCQHEEQQRIPSNYAGNGRILIRKTDDPIEDEFIKKKPARPSDPNRKRWKGEKAINWKLYMAHRCLQLSDHMNVDDHGVKAGRAAIPPASLTKKTPPPSPLKDGDFRRRRSNNQGEDNLRDSFRYTGLRFEEYEGTINIEEVIANKAGDDRHSNSVATERVCVLRDQETTCVDPPTAVVVDSSLSVVVVDSPSSAIVVDPPLAAVIDPPSTDVVESLQTPEDVKLAEWQTYVEEGNKNSEWTSEERVDSAALPTERPKSFLETIDIRDFVGPAEPIAEESTTNVDKTPDNIDEKELLPGQPIVPIENPTAIEMDLLEMYDFDSTDIWVGEAADSFETKLEDEGFSETTIDLSQQEEEERLTSENKESDATPDTGVSPSEGEEMINVEVDEKLEMKLPVKIEVATEEEKEEEEGQGEEPRSEEQTTTSLDKSEDYHDADLPGDVDDKDEEETTETVFYDTESESSVAEDELALSKKEGDPRTLVESSPLIAGKKDASQKSVHFHISDENGEQEPKTTPVEENVNIATLDTIYHVANENPGAVAVFLESHSDVSCPQRPLLGAQPNEKISLIEGVAPSDQQISHGDGAPAPPMAAQDLLLISYLNVGSTSNSINYLTTNKSTGGDDANSQHSSDNEFY